MVKLARIKWPQKYSELQRIEELLLCGICYDYMDTSVMTACSHNYCSLCIRKYLHYKTQCPACFEKTFEKDLHANRILDELILYFGKLREKLVECVAGAKIVPGHDDESITDSSSFTPVRPARMNQNQKKTPPKIESKRIEVLADAACKIEERTQFVGTTETIPSSPGTSGASKIANIFTPKSKKKVTGTTTLPCPVCKVEISDVNMNKHLDNCLKRETASQEQPARTELKRKPLPKLVLSLMKDTELRKKLKELGLPGQGDRKTIEARFHRYSTLYNAECDKKSPRPVSELLKQCDDEEALEKKMLKFSQATNVTKFVSLTQPPAKCFNSTFFQRLKVNRNTEQNIIDEARKNYLESNKKNYQTLISTIKERAESQKAMTADPLIESSDNLVANHVNLSEDELSRTSYSVNAFDADFLDSDSDVCCPLQRYTSDDPTSFLSIQMSTSGDESSVQSPEPKSSPTQIHTNEGASVNSPSNNRNCPLTFENPAKNGIDCEKNENLTNSCHSTKRVKLTLRKALIDDDNESKENTENKLEGKKLALAIARDFTFDSSSNESTGCDVTNETVLATEKPETLEIEEKTVDKENNELCAAIAVDRPLRKRNCVTRAQSNNKSKDMATVLVEETQVNITEERENVLASASCNDSIAKRRRRRNNETPDVPKNPPKRPLRKRNSVAKD